MLRGIFENPKVLRSKGFCGLHQILFRDLLAEAAEMEMGLPMTNPTSSSLGFPGSYKPVRANHAGKNFKGSSSYRHTHINDIPNPVLSIIFSLVQIARSRNAIALTCREWYKLERATRTTLCLRGNTSNFHLLPLCFHPVTFLDISNCSPWGYSLFKAQASLDIAAHCLQQAFPNVTELTAYVRDAIDIQIVAFIWPDLETLRLNRWHQRATQPETVAEIGMELHSLFHFCRHLKCLDLSKFYCWTEDIPSAMTANASVCKNLQILNLLKLSPEGFKSDELDVITSTCVNLLEFYVLCTFDPRYVDSVGDAALKLLASNCKLLRVLHLVDFNEHSALHRNPDDGYAEENASITLEGLRILFQSLPQLQDLALLLAQNVRDSGEVLESLSWNCKHLIELKLSYFHGICNGDKLDGLAQCSGLRKLSIKNCVDLKDAGVEAIAHGCPLLSKLALHSCREVSKVGLQSCVTSLAKTLVDLEVVSCRLLSTDDVLHSLEPVQASLQYLHIDCLLGDKVPARGKLNGSAEVDRYEARSSQGHISAVKRMAVKKDPSFNTGPLDQLADSTVQTITLKFFESKDNDLDDWQPIKSKLTSRIKRAPPAYGIEALKADAEDSQQSKSCNEESKRSTYFDQSAFCTPIRSKMERVRSISPEHGIACLEGDFSHNSHKDDTDRTLMHSSRRKTKCWSRLTSLSLWIPVSGDIALLPRRGLKSCPVLQELSIKVEGDCRQLSKPPAHPWGLEEFSIFPALTKLRLDLSEVVGYALSCPEGNLDLSPWERYYLNGIQNLNLTEVDYSPPTDKDLHHKGLSLPGAGLLSECSTLRKLFIHGTTDEHLLFMLLHIPNLRDVQLREDYYPAPESESSTKTRAESCKRFEVALADRGFPD